MPSTRRSNSYSSSDDEEELEQSRKMPRRTRAAAVSYAEEKTADDDDDDDEIEGDNASSVGEEVLSEEDDEMDESDFEQEAGLRTRRSTRVSKKNNTTEVLTERRVSSRNNKSKANMKGHFGDVDSQSDDESNVEHSEEESISPKKSTKDKTSVRSPKERLSIASLGLPSSDYAESEEEEEDDDDESLGSVEEESNRKRGRPRKGEEKPKRARRQRKENEPPKQDFAPFKIAKIIASRTESRSKWMDVCKTMNTSEVHAGSRWLQDPPTDENDNNKLEERFLIKWNDTTFMHCSWETEKDLLTFVEQAILALSRFRKKSQDDGRIFTSDERCDGDYFDPAWAQIDRIMEVHNPEGCIVRVEDEDEAKPEDFGIIMDMDHDEYDQALGRQLLIKWENLPYSECSYEFERDLILSDISYIDKIKQYRTRTMKTSAASAKQNLEQGEAEIRRLYKDVFGERSESKLETGPADYQAALIETEYANGGKLRDYQAEGVSWLMSNYINKRSSILADEMGLGKTIQIASFLDLLASKLHRRGPFLVVVPLSTFGNWKKELEGWLGGINSVFYHGTAKDRTMIRNQEMAFESDRPVQCRTNELFLRKCCKAQTSTLGNPWMFEVLVTTPEMLCTDDFVELTTVKWECVVIDEAHRLKNHNSKLAKILRDSRFDFGHKILLTGTPIQNTMEELFALLSFVDPILFGDCDEFMEKYGKMTSKENLDSLHEEIRPYLLRRLKEDVEKSVPPKEETVIEVELTISQKQYYRALYEKNAKFLRKNKKKAVDGPSLINLAMQLRKCCNHLFLLKGIEEEFRRNLNEASLSEGDVLVRASGKLVLLDKLLPRLKENGHRILIFSQFKIMLDVLEDYFNDRAVKFERIDGSITGSKRQQAIDRFQAPTAEGKTQPFVMLLSTRAGGVGINLTAADTCIIFDSDFNPQNDLQAQARCHRIGQTKSVKVYRLLTRKSYEMQMFHMASLKMGLDQAVLSGFEAGGEKALSKEEVERLLRIGAYGILEEDKEGAEAASNAFAAEDIDTILERHSRVIVHENTGSGSAATGGKFSKARFTTTSSPSKGGTEKSAVDIEDPNFWEKMLGHVQEDDEKEGEEEIVGKRARTQKNYDEAINEYKLSGDEGEGEAGDDGAASDVSFEQVEESESDSEDEAALLAESGPAPYVAPSVPSVAPSVAAAQPAPSAATAPSPLKPAAQRHAEYWNLVNSQSSLQQTQNNSMNVGQQHQQQQPQQQMPSMPNQYQLQQLLQQALVPQRQQYGNAMPEPTHSMNQQQYAILVAPPQGQGQMMGGTQQGAYPTSNAQYQQQQQQQGQQMYQGAPMQGQLPDGQQPSFGRL